MHTACRAERSNRKTAVGFRLRRNVTLHQLIPFIFTWLWANPARLSRHLDWTVFGWFALKKKGQNDCSKAQKCTSLGGGLCFVYDDVYTDLKTAHRLGRGFYITDLGVAGAASRHEQSSIPLLWAGVAPLPALLEWTLAWRPVRHRDFCDCRQKYALLLRLSLETKYTQAHIYSAFGDVRLGGNKRISGGNRTAAARLRSQLCPSTCLCSIFKAAYQSSQSEFCPAGEFHQLWSHRLKR